MAQRNVEQIFDEFSQQGWDDNSKLDLLRNFVDDVAKIGFAIVPSKTLYDKLEVFLQEQTDEENALDADEDEDDDEDFDDDEDEDDEEDDEQ